MGGRRFLKPFLLDPGTRFPSRLQGLAIFKGFKQLAHRFLPSPFTMMSIKGQSFIVSLGSAEGVPAPKHDFRPWLIQFHDADDREAIVDRLGRGGEPDHVVLV